MFAIQKFTLYVELKRVLEEYALIQNSHWAAMQAQMSIAVSNGVQTNPASFFKEFSKVNHLESHSLWQSTRTIEAFSRKPKNIGVLKQGLLYRPSKLGMGLWVAVIAVLTETGFFHTFAIPQSQKHLIQYYQKKELDRHSIGLSDDADFFKDYTRPEFRYTAYSIT